jgi:hypothetical protein
MRAAKKTPVTRADLELELHRLWPERMASPAFAQRPSLTLDVPEVGGGYQSAVNLGRGATIYGGGPSKQAARRNLLESLQELAPGRSTPPPRDIRSERQDTHCPHGNPYASKYACATCENST